MDPNTKLCFSDASWHKETKKAGLGWCFFGSDSTFLNKGSLTLDFISSPLMAEATTVLVALRFAHLMGWKIIQVNSDSKALIKLVNDGGESKESTVFSKTSRIRTLCSTPYPLFSYLVRQIC